MPRDITGEQLADYRDLTTLYETADDGTIVLSQDIRGQFVGIRGGGYRWISRAEAQRILLYNQLITGETDEARSTPDRLEPTPTFFPDLIGPPWPGADRRGPRTKWAEYDPELRRVTMEFRNGDIYRYLEVPPQVWETLKTQASTGQFINSVLNEYPYQKIKSGARE